MNNNFIETLGEEDLQHGFVNPPLWDGSFYVLVLQRSCSSLSKCRKTHKKDGTQVGAQILLGDNGDDDNDHGEELMENPLIITKYWAQLGMGIIDQIKIKPLGILY